MKKIAFSFLVIAMLALPVFAQNGKFAAPANVELDKFPIKPAPFLFFEQAELGLSPKKLEKPVVVFNHFRNLRDKEGRFAMEELPTGTIVLVDKNGVLRYKADCGNRISEYKQCPTCPALTEAEKKLLEENRALLAKGGKNGVGNGNGISDGPGAWARFTDSFGKAWDGVASFAGTVLGGLLPLLGVLAALALLGLLGYLIYRAIRDSRSNGANNAAPPMTPPPAQPQQAQPQPPAQSLAQTGNGQQGQNLFVMPPAPGAGTPPSPPSPAPQPVSGGAGSATPPQGFPADRVVIDIGRGKSATRIQVGDNVTRVERNKEPDGSTTFRIFNN